MAKKKKKLDQNVTIPESAPLPHEAATNLETAPEVIEKIEDSLEVSLDLVSSESHEPSNTQELTPQDTSAENSNSSDATPPNVALVTDRTQIKQVLEAVIFAAPRAITLLRLKNILTHFSYDVSGLKEILEELVTETQDRGFQLTKIAGGYQYRSHPEHAEVLQKLLEDKPARLGGSALEVLAIVAYKQPITRSEIDSVRGVDSGHLLKGLLEKNLIRTAGHAETPGRPLLYGTTPYFLEVFTLNSLDDLPAAEEFKRELAPSAESGSEGLSSDAPNPADLLIDSSGLSAEANHGSYNSPIEDSAESPDFGLAERAREEVEREQPAEA